jgi:hypothetical protein
MWTAVEVNTGIVCSCIPAIRALFKLQIPDRLKPKGMSSYVFSSARKKGSTPSSSTSNYQMMTYTQSTKATTRSVKVAVQGVNLNKPLPVTPRLGKFGNLNVI